MTPDEALAEAKSGKLRPVYLVAGEESHLADQVVRALREAVTRQGIPGLNDDTLTAASGNFTEALQIARTQPMMASRRFLLVRDLEKWESQKKDGSAPLDQLVEYVVDPAPTTVLVLASTKLDKRRKLYTTAKSSGFLVSCDTPNQRELPGWIVERVKGRGNSISHSTAALLAELLGPELGPVADAVERLCLYVGQGKSIDEEAVSACVVRLRTASVWQLVDAVARRDVGTALALFDDVFDPGARDFSLIGTFSWATRQLIRFDAARKRGLDPSEAAKAAGAPPFKARDLESQLKGLSSETLSGWLEHVARADLALKGGSKRPPRSTLEQVIIELCRGA
ncbi:MAG TPA: DNA polymerase III subunit delta [Polyangiaceae bacterium]|nr:DNA polymerase III subunit delta [Polyangiaceae bacterium]